MLKLIKVAFAKRSNLINFTAYQISTTVQIVPDLMYFVTYSSDDPHNDVGALLATYNEKPESESPLKILLPHILSSFAANKSVSESIEELKKLEQSTDSAGIYSFTETNIKLKLLLKSILMFDLSNVSTRNFLLFNWFTKQMKDGLDN